MAFTVTGNTTYCDHGSAASLDGVLGGACTIMMWVRRTANAANQALVDKGWVGASAGALVMSENASGEGQIRFLRGGSTGYDDRSSAAGRMPLNTWAFIAISAPAYPQSSNIKFYYGLRGVSAVEETSYSGNVNGTGTYGSDNAASLIVGKQGADYFRGDIQSLVIVPSQLTLAQIQLQQERSTPISGLTSSLFCFYTNAPSATDQSGNLNNGTFNGSPTHIADLAMLTDIAVTSANIQFSPYNWYSDGGGAMASTNIKGSSTLARTNTPGAYLKFKATIATGSGGAVRLVVNNANLNGLTANKCPVLASFTDLKSQTRTQLVYAATDNEFIIATGLSNGTYEFEVHFVAIGLNTPGDRWSTPAQSVTVKGVALYSTDSIGAPTVRTKKMIVFGDSIPEGAGVIGSADVEAVDNDAYQTWIVNVAKALDAEYGAIAFGGSGYIRGINNVAASSSNPCIYSSTDANQYYNKYYSGQSRLISSAFSPVPDYVFVSAGSNDSGLVAADVTAALDAIRTAAGSSAWMFVLSGPNALSPASTISSGVAAVADTTKTKLIAIGTLYTAGTASIYASDAGAGGNHANVRGHAIVGAIVVKQAQGYMGTGGGLLAHPGMRGGFA